ncbi:MAG: amidohydrolase, partial [Anaerolineae bacterium]|nr:amidohydrolase [Anaerolineae bacterium]
MKQPLHLKNAIVVAHGQAQRRDLYIDRGRFTAQPAPRALTVDLDGETLFAGLVNAHDHLELNHYPRTAYRQVYTSAHHWGDDVNARLDTLPFRVRRAYPLRDRLFIGGLKNLLCGATTVIQHGPAHAALFRPDFPVRVLRPYGWSHSLHFSPAAAVVASYRRTPPGVPWFIHLAEGTDAAAAGEYQRLKALGCAGSNTVLVHGVG